MKEITKIINVLQEQINDSINLRQEEIAGANLALNKLKKLLPKANPVENRVAPKIAETIDDGFGNSYPKYCKCGYPYEIVRPGKIQCPKCG